MEEFEHIFRLLQKQLSPYKHIEDIKTDGSRWGLKEGDYLRDWFLQTLKSCMRRNKCSKRERCCYFEYSDQAKNNFRVCNYIILMLENGLLEITPVEEAR